MDNDLNNDLTTLEKNLAELKASQTRQSRAAVVMALLFLLLTAQTSVMRVGKLNNVRKCDYTGYSGSNAGAKIASCINDLPSTGGIVDARGFEGNQTSTTNPFAGETKPITLLLGDATISTTVPWVITSAKQSITGNGMSSILKASAAMDQVLFVDGNAAGNGISANVINGIRIDGNGLATDGLRLRRAVASYILNVSVTNITGAGFHCVTSAGGSCVVTTFINPAVSSNIETFTTVPDKGIAFDDTESSANVIINGRFEGLTTSTNGVGIYDYGQANVYIGGTSEGNKRGIWVGTGGNHRFSDMFLEQNSVYDIRTEGFEGVYRGMIASSAVASATQIAAGAYLNKFMGGSYDRIVNDSVNPNTFSDITVITSFTDNGTGTIRNNVRDNSGPVSPDNIDANPYRNLAVYSSSEAQPTAFTVRAHASAQGTTNLSGWYNASNVLQSAISEGGFVETTRLDGIDGTRGFLFAGSVATMPNGNLVVGASGTASGLATFVSSDGTVTGVFGVDTGSGGSVYLGAQTDDVVTIRANNTAVMTLQQGASLGKVTFAPITHSSLGLGVQTNGTIVYCSDCTVANPCASGGTGALAKRLNGVWVCD